MGRMAPSLPLHGRDRRIPGSIRPLRSRAAALGARPRRRSSRARAVTALVAALIAGAAPPAAADDLEALFGRGAWIVGLDVGAGSQALGRDERSDVAFFSLSPRVSLLPFDPFGPDWLRGTVELGLEGWFQHYTYPARTLGVGLKLAARYHVLRGSRWVPYVEATAGAGGTSLNVPEIDSNFTFVLEAGAGVAYVVERKAVTIGVRLFHVSNADLDTPNTGVNAIAGHLGIAVFLP